jgi:polygalacturonase
MKNFSSMRRDFLRFGSVGIAAAAIPAVPFVASPQETASVSQGLFDVRKYGATGDGKTLDTDAVNHAIEAASAAGGGVVVFPPGTYLCFSIHLKSQVHLHLQQGSTIVAADSPRPGEQTGYRGGTYDAAEPNTAWDAYQDYGHNHWHNSLLWGENLQDFSITGPGLIWGKGLSHGRSRENAPFVAEQPGVGNKAIALKNCRNVIFRDFTIFHGGHFGILAEGVDNWTCDNLKIDTNRDGIDFDCCQNVRVSNCTVNSPNDDGICPKSSYSLGYSRMTENVTITNCQVSGFDEGTLLDNSRKRLESRSMGAHGPTGRIKCGTESNGGFRNITISNCVFEYCRGLAFESVDGALMEDIAVSNITMRDIINAPIYIRLGARLRGPAGTTIGTARRIKIENVVAHNVAAEAGILIEGVPGTTINDVSLSNIFIDFEGGGTAEDAKRVVAEDVDGYPEPARLGKLSSWGLFARHVKNFSMDHVELRVAKEDLRPVVSLEDVSGVDIDHAVFSHAPGVKTVVLKNVTGLTIRDSGGLPDTKKAGTTSDGTL